MSSLNSHVSWDSRYAKYANMYQGHSKIMWPWTTTPALFKISLKAPDMNSFLKVGESVSERYGVDSVILHPEFRQGALFNFDFAIIQLNRPVDFKSVSSIR